jgi:hypothetical protein
MITLVGMVRDEAKYLAEWLTYHWLIGVTDFVIYLHNCADDSARVISQLPFPVTAIAVTSAEIGWEFKNRIYRAGLDAAKTPWAVCLDIDEFLCLPGHENIAEFLAQPKFDSASGIAVHQNIFGFGGHTVSPAGLVIENYTLRNSDDPLRDRLYPQYHDPADLFKTVKVIVRPEQVVKILDSHTFLCRQKLVTEDGELFKKYQCRRVLSEIRLNHYFTKSQEDWKAKTARARLSGASMYPPAWFEYFGAQATIDKTLADKFPAKIKEYVRLWP